MKVFWDFKTLLWKAWEYHALKKKKKKKEMLRSLSYFEDNTKFRSGSQ